MQIHINNNNHRISPESQQSCLNRNHIQNINSNAQQYLIIITTQTQPNNAVFSINSSENLQTQPTTAYSNSGIQRTTILKSPGFSNTFSNENNNNNAFSHHSNSTAAVNRKLSLPVHVSHNKQQEKPSFIPDSRIKTNNNNNNNNNNHAFYTKYSFELPLPALEREENTNTQSMPSLICDLDIIDTSTTNRKTDKRFKCSECNRLFKRKSNMRIHQVFI